MDDQRLAELERVAQQVGTPFWFIDAAEMRQRIAEVKGLVASTGMKARFAMKANPNWRVLREMRSAGFWIDAVSANECRRAMRVGYALGSQQPEILFTADVFRDAWREVVCVDGILPNLGSPGMVEDLRDAGYRGPVALRVNVGFGHGHVNTCDTGGPSSKHGIWWEDAVKVAERVHEAGCQVVMLHAHVGSGPQQEELRENLVRLTNVFVRMIADFPEVEAVSLGGGLPWNYRQPEPLDLAGLAHVLQQARQDLVRASGKNNLRLEIEPGRYLVASAVTLVTRVTDLKATRTNAKGEGRQFIMVDAGFVDLVRPAMYGSYHEISIPARQGESLDPWCVAGPLCESGDVFTRGADELLKPRLLPTPRRGDLLLLHDAGAYGYAMSSNYNSIGRAPQVWREHDGSVSLVSRREKLEDLIAAEVDQPL